jgi:hypothetical protein
MQDKITTHVWVTHRLKVWKIFKYLGATLTNQNCFYGENNGRSTYWNASYPSIQTLSSSNLLSKNVNVNVIPHGVLYGCETSSLILRKEHRLRVFENRVLRRIFGHNRDEVTGEWRRLHNDELSDLYWSLNIIWVIKTRRWAGHVARIEERTGAYSVLAGRPVGNRPRGRF